MTVEYRISEIAEKVNAKINGDADGVITGLAPLMKAGAGELSFLAGGQYRKYLKDTQATAVLVSEKFAADCPVNALIVPNPELAYARVAALFQWKPVHTPGIHPQAVVAATAKIDSSVSIGPFCMIGEHVTIAKNTVIMAGTNIDAHTQIGESCVLHSRVSVYHHTVIGNRVILHSGVVVGCDGFGLAQDQGRWEVFRS